MYLKKNTRKKDCEICGVSAGSPHNKKCKYAYIMREDTKRIKTRLSITQKIKLIICILFERG